MNLLSAFPTRQSTPPTHSGRVCARQTLPTLPSSSYPTREGGCVHDGGQHLISSCPPQPCSLHPGTFILCCLHTLVIAFLLTPGPPSFLRRIIIISSSLWRVVVFLSKKCVLITAKARFPFEHRANVNCLAPSLGRPTSFSRPCVRVTMKVETLGFLYIPSF